MKVEDNAPYSRGLLIDAGIIDPVEVIDLTQFKAQVKVFIHENFGGNYVDEMPEEKAVYLIYNKFPDLNLIIQGALHASKMILNDDDEESVSYLSSHIATEIFCKLNNIEL
jgi:hypothetical protein